MSQLNNSELEKIVNAHFNHWVKHNPLLDRKTTEEKFKNIYTQNELPFGIAIFLNNELAGFCVLKKLNLKAYPEIFPWISDVYVFEKFRNKKVGTELVKNAEEILKKFQYDQCYVWTDVAPTFYEKLGYSFVMEITKNEGGTGKLFKKNL